MSRAFETMSPPNDLVRPAMAVRHAGSAALHMHQDGHEFYLAANGVWLVEHVPPEYLTP